MVRLLEVGRVLDDKWFVNKNIIDMLSILTYNGLVKKKKNSLPNGEICRVNIL